MDKNDSANQSKIVIRDGVSEDTPFLEKLYFETRKDEFAQLGWDAPQIEALLKMQFMTQTQSYRMQFPDARNFVIEADGEAVGRLITTDEIRLVDIAVLPEFRNRGIGSFVLRRLLEEAEDKKKPVDLQVLKTNSPAIRLYERFGFEKTGEDQLYLMMRRQDSSG
jgi:ribosomal protein S18 acetylase RimI-like enzyme